MDHIIVSGEAHLRRIGGSTDSDDTEVTVIPVMSLPRPTVITLTPPAR